MNSIKNFFRINNASVKKYFFVTSNFFLMLYVLLIISVLITNISKSSCTEMVEAQAKEFTDPLSDATIIRYVYTINGSAHIYEYEHEDDCKLGDTLTLYYDPKNIMKISNIPCAPYDIFMRCVQCTIAILSVIIVDWFIAKLINEALCNAA